MTKEEVFQDPKRVQYKSALPNRYTLKQWEIGKVLGQGAFGITYLAWDSRLHKAVVIKEFFPDDSVYRDEDGHGVYAKNKEEHEKVKNRLFDKFEEEAQNLLSLRELNHPNIAQGMNHFKANNTRYLVMHFEKGETVADKMLWRNKDVTPLPFKIAMRIFTDALQGLIAVHGHNLLHRDLHIGNLFVKANGETMILDFGLATDLQDAINSNSVEYGHFSPPEKRKSNVPMGAYSDTYMLSSSLFFMLTGDFFSAPDLMMEGEDYFLNALPKTPECAKLKPILLKALKYRPNERYQTAQALYNDVLNAFPQSPNVIVPPEAGTARFDELSGLTFVYCPKGDFTLGSEAVQKDWSDCPPTPKRITEGFWLAETPLTQAQFRRFINETGYQTEAERNVGYDGTRVYENRKWENKKGRNWRNIFVGDTRPVVGVSWNDAQKYLEWLNQKSQGKVQYKLPSEAQWEYACRAGTTTENYFGDNAKDLGKYAWFCDNSGNETKPVKGKFSNAWNLYDMHGNVWEWCEDYYDKEYYAKSLFSDPKNTSSQSSSRVLRGGSWVTPADFLRAARRYNNRPSKRRNNISFRPVFII